MATRFFVKQMIKRLFIDRIVYYDHNSSKWICDEDKLTDYEISANVIEFMSNALSGTTKLAHRF